MIGFLRLMIFGLVGLTIAYWLMLIYMRSLRREDLENEWDEVSGEGLPPRDTYIDEGMSGYEHSLRRKLVWLVVIVPICLFGVLLYFMNFNS